MKHHIAAVSALMYIRVVISSLLILSALPCPAQQTYFSGNPQIYSFKGSVRSIESKCYFGQRCSWLPLPLKLNYRYVNQVITFFDTCGNISLDCYFDKGVKSHCARFNEDGNAIAEYILIDERMVVQDSFLYNDKGGVIEIWNFDDAGVLKSHRVLNPEGEFLDILHPAEDSLPKIPKLQMIPTVISDYAVLIEQHGLEIYLDLNCDGEVSGYHVTIPDQSHGYSFERGSCYIWKTDTFYFPSFVVYFDAKGRETSIRNYDSRVLGSETRFIYYPNGLLRKRTVVHAPHLQDEVDYSWKYKYRYDKQGNWVRLVESKGLFRTKNLLLNTIDYY